MGEPGRGSDVLTPPGRMGILQSEAHVYSANCVWPKRGTHVKGFGHPPRFSPIDAQDPEASLGDRPLDLKIAAGRISLAHTRAHAIDRDPTGRRVDLPAPPAPACTAL